jgi:uncharacterized membrane protein
MHCMLVIAFENEAIDNEAKTALLQLDREGAVVIYGYAVIAKSAGGSLSINQADAYGTLSPSTRTLLESLSDQTDAALGAAPQVSDLTAASSAAKTRKDFIDDVRKVLLPHRVAIVAEVEEEWPYVVDSRMESIGGIVFRWTMSEAQHAAEM